MSATPPRNSRTLHRRTSSADAERLCRRPACHQGGGQVPGGGLVDGRQAGQVGADARDRHAADPVNASRQQFDAADVSGVLAQPVGGTINRIITGAGNARVAAHVV